MSKSLFEGTDWWNEDEYSPEEEKKGPVPNKTHRQVKSRLETKKKLKKETVEQILTERLDPDHTLHIVSNGSFDYWNLVVRLIELHEIQQATFYGTTWTMNDQNTQSLLELIDTGRIAKATMMVGLYFLHREPVVADTLKEGLEGRAQRFMAHDNHAKVVLLQSQQDYLVIEGSANFTSNPRIEQYVLNNDKDLYEFHKEWMDQYYERGNTRKGRKAK